MNSKITTWSQVRGLTNWATQAPQLIIHSCDCFCCIPKVFFFLHLFRFFLRNRVRQSMSGGGAEREGDIESEAGSRLWASGQYRAWCGAGTHELWDHDLSRSQMLNRLSHPGAPPPKSFRLLCSHYYLFPYIFHYVFKFLIWPIYSLAVCCLTFTYLWFFKKKILE